MLVGDVFFVMLAMLENTTNILRFTCATWDRTLSLVLQKRGRYNHAARRPHNLYVLNEPVTKGLSTDNMEDVTSLFNHWNDLGHSEVVFVCEYLCNPDTATECLNEMRTWLKKHYPMFRYTELPHFENVPVRKRFVITVADDPRWHNYQRLTGGRILPSDIATEISQYAFTNRPGWGT